MSLLRLRTRAAAPGLWFMAWDLLNISRFQNPPPDSKPMNTIRNLFIAIAAFFTISCLAAAQGTGPVGGFTLPLWQIASDSINAKAEVVPDLTGDGIEDVYLARYDNGNDVVIDGKNGELWFEVPIGFRNGDPAKIHDFDGDGIADLILRNGNYSTSSISDAGAILLIQGGSGRLLWHLRGSSVGQKLGSRIKAVDLDGDQLLDVFSYTPNHEIQAISGLDGSSIWNHALQGVQAVKKYVDVNGDGIEDLLGYSISRLRAIDGATGITLWENANNIVNPGQWLNIEYQDFTGDGIEDVFVSNIDISFAGQPGMGGVQLFDNQTGQLLWEAFGSNPYQRFGQYLSFYDANGDQILDAYVASRTEQRLLDGRDGSSLWAQNISFSTSAHPDWLTADLNHDGVPDHVYRASDTGNSIKAVNGADGSILWQAMQTDPSAYAHELQAVDLDNDGDLDVVATVPSSIGGGEIMALDGADGSRKWTKVASHPDDNFGMKLTHHTNRNGDCTIITHLFRQDRSSTIMGFTGVSGVSNWELDQEYDTYSLNWNWLDLDNDQNLELLSFNENNMDALLIDPADGSVLNRFLGEAIYPEWLGTISDVDGDGCREVVSGDSRSWGGGPHLEMYSGKKWNHTSGLNLIGDQLSIFNGGLVVIGARFPLPFAGNSYRLLLSSTGTGPTLIEDALVPLTDDATLQRSLAGDYSIAFHAPIGRLDANAEAVLAIQATPNQIPTSLLGLEIHLAVVVDNFLRRIGFSTGAESITIVL